MGGIAAGQSQVLVEQLEAVGQAEEQADGDGGHQVGQLDLPEDLPLGGAVDAGGLQIVPRDGLQAGDIDDHHIADLLPAHEDDQTDEAVGSMEGHQGLAQQGQNAVEQDVPDIAQHDAADQIGHEVDGAEQVGALDLPGQGQSDGQGRDVDGQGGHHGEQGGKPEGVEEIRLRQSVNIVGQAVEGGLVNGDEPAEGQVQALQEGPHEADDKRRQRGQDEHRPISLDRFFHNITPKESSLSPWRLLRCCLRRNRIKKRGGR